jgi:hypothetical protein
MTNAKLTKMQNAETAKYETAKKINDLLAEAAKAAGLKGDEAQEYEAAILELVQEED